MCISFDKVELELVRALSLPLDNTASCELNNCEWQPWYICKTNKKLSLDNDGTFFVDVTRGELSIGTPAHIVTHLNEKTDSDVIWKIHEKSSVSCQLCLTNISAACYQCGSLSILWRKCKFLRSLCIVLHFWPFWLCSSLLLKVSFKTKMNSKFGNRKHNSDVAYSDRRWAVNKQADKSVTC